jgi:hypothetical protein
VRRRPNQTLGIELTFGPDQHQSGNAIGVAAAALALHAWRAGPKWVGPHGGILRMRVMTPHEHREGVVARTIEQQTAKLPSDTFLWLAGGSIATSLTLKLMGRHEDALFVGQWAPTFLILGLYNKIVKVMGSD